MEGNVDICIVWNIIFIIPVKIFAIKKITNWWSLNKYKVFVGSFKFEEVIVEFIEEVNKLSILVLLKLLLLFMNGIEGDEIFVVELIIMKSIIYKIKILIEDINKIIEINDRFINLLEGDWI